MERLTERDEFDNAAIIKCPSENFVLDLEFNELNAVTEALNRLAEYEDTGLSPKEVTKLKKENAELKLQNETLTSCLE